MDTFYLYGLVALIAALLKIAILSQVITRSQITSAFNLICLCMIAQHSLEFLGYFTYAKDNAFGNLMVDGIMVANYFVIAAAGYFVLTICESRYSKLGGLAFLSGAVALSILHFSGLLLTGYQNVGYTLIPEFGAYYIAFPLFLALAAIVSVALLIRGWLRGSAVVKARCKLTVYALAPVTLTGMGILIAQLLGAQISGAIILPIMSTAFVWAMMMDERGDIVTFKIKWRILWTLATNIKSVNLRDWMDIVEQQLILEAMNSSDNNQSAAARLLGSNKTTFHRKVQKVYGSISDQPASEEAPSTEPTQQLPVSQTLAIDR